MSSMKTIVLRQRNKMKYDQIKEKDTILYSKWKTKKNFINRITRFRLVDDDIELTDAACQSDDSHSTTEGIISSTTDQPLVRPPAQSKPKFVPSSAVKKKSVNIKPIIKPRDKSMVSSTDYRRDGKEKLFFGKPTSFYSETFDPTVVAHPNEPSMYVNNSIRSIPPLSSVNSNFQHFGRFDSLPYGMAVSFPVGIPEPPPHPHPQGNMGKRPLISFSLHNSNQPFVNQRQVVPPPVPQTDDASSKAALEYDSFLQLDDKEIIRQYENKTSNNKRRLDSSSKSLVNNNQPSTSESTKIVKVPSTKSNSSSSSSLKKAEKKFHQSNNNKSAIKKEQKSSNQKVVLNKTSPVTAVKNDHNLSSRKTGTNKLTSPTFEKTLQQQSHSLNDKSPRYTQSSSNTSAINGIAHSTTNVDVSSLPSSSSKRCVPSTSDPVPKRLKKQIVNNIFPINNVKVECVDLDTSNEWNELKSPVKASIESKQSCSEKFMENEKSTLGKIFETQENWLKPNKMCKSEIFDSFNNIPHLPNIVENSSLISLIEQSAPMPNPRANNLLPANNLEDVSNNSKREHGNPKVIEMWKLSEKELQIVCKISEIEGVIEDLRKRLDQALEERTKMKSEREAVRNKRLSLKKENE